jgi:membrane protease YdiL (CAAX protease family)
LLATFAGRILRNGKFTTQTAEKRMAHLATKRQNYWSQLAILAGLTGAGFLIGGVISLIPMLNQFDLSEISKLTQKQIEEKILIPENANVLRLTQFIATFFLFFIPAWVYAKFCHTKPITHLGFKHKVNAGQIGIVIAIIIACLPIVGALQDLTESIPFSKAMFAKFKAAEDDYEAQIKIIGKMENFPEFLFSLFMLAILPAVFEEVMFRGAIQNLFSRWWGMPIIAILVTSILFSAVHFSYLGFLSRAALGFVLGWMYYRTGNLWLPIIAHGVNNAVALTALYITKKNNPGAAVSDTDPNVPSWIGLVAVGLVYGLFILFERVSKSQINNPGKEELIVYEDINRPNWTR